VSCKRKSYVDYFAELDHIQTIERCAKFGRKISRTNIGKKEIYMQKITVTTNLKGKFATILAHDVSEATSYKILV
jgi:hypothetical protein